MKNNGKSIQNTMIRMTAVLGSVFLLFLVGILFEVREIVTDIAKEYSLTTSQKLENLLEAEYQKMEVFAMNISKEESVRALLTDDDSQIVKNLSSVKEILIYYRILEPTISDIAIVNDRIHYSSLYSEEDLDELAAENNTKSFSWLETRYSSFISHQNNAACLLYSMPVWQDGSYIGSVLISLDSSVLDMEASGVGQAVHLLATEDEVIYPINCDKAEAGKVWDIWKQLGYAAGRKDHMVIQCVYSDSMECWQISALDLEQVSAYLVKVKGMIYSCVLVLAGFLLAIVFLMERRVVHPLRRFQNIIQERAVGQEGRQKDAPISGIGGCREIEEIREAFNHLMEEQKNLNHRIFQTASDLYETKIQKQQAELSYMRSQVDPHFLYNTLETIRKMAVLKDAPEIARMAVDMGTIFRYSARGSEEVYLQEEINVVKSYIAIQRKRFENKIHVFYSVPDDILQCRVIKMLLQPIAENSILHGLEPKESSGNLFLAARAEEDMLVLIVKDDGIGMDEKRLHDIWESLEQTVYDTSRHVGLLNTQARIRLNYGKEYGISIESSSGDGTTVTLRLPVRKDEENHVKSSDCG